jgi:hypothetical protein
VAGGLILDFLRTQSESVEESAIHEGVEGRKVIKQKALRRLVEQKKVNRSGEGKRNNPYRYSFCSSLAPIVSGESENQKPETAVTQHFADQYSGSQRSTDNDEPVGTWESETEMINLVD